MCYPGLGWGDVVSRTEALSQGLAEKVLLGKLSFWVKEKAERPWRRRVTPRGTSSVQGLHGDAGGRAVPEPKAWPIPAPHVHSDLIGHCLPHFPLWTWVMGAPGGGPGLACGDVVFAFIGLRPLNMTPLTLGLYS